LYLERINYYSPCNLKELFLLARY